MPTSDGIFPRESFFLYKLSLQRWVLPQVCYCGTQLNPVDKLVREMKLKLKLKPTGSRKRCHNCSPNLWLLFFYCKTCFGSSMVPWWFHQEQQRRPEIASLTVVVVYFFYNLLLLSIIQVLFISKILLLYNKILEARVVCLLWEKARVFQTRSFSFLLLAFIFQSSRLDLT